MAGKMTGKSARDNGLSIEKEISDFVRTSPSEPYAG